LGGEHPIFAELETAFAAFKGAEASLYFPSGYAANESVITTLARLPGTAFFSDALNHASLIDGFRLAALPAARKSIYRHADMEDLEKHLRKSTAEINIIVTETVFSMDGDCAPLLELEALARRYRGVLVLDEAHAIFVWGTQGRGLAPQCADLDIMTIDTAGKALGVQGALVSGPGWLRELLINQARPFIYTTAASPWLAAALLATLRASTRFQARRERLAALSQQVLRALKAQGWDTGPSSTQIIPILLGPDAQALAKSQALRARNLLVPAIRPPTVAEGSARLRLSLHSQLTDTQITDLIQAFA
jgi:8-amino-7-oxononanoate synthase